ILPLAEHFLDDDAVLSDEARDAMLAYAWPGNVRELKNTIDRAKLLCGRDEITAEHLGLPIAAPAASRSLDDPPREAVEDALKKAGGVISRAARTLGLSRQALYRRMQRYGIPTES
ncbi:MAG TPA: helix-turn-helix domain-containing protein, partial [Rhodanobacteraceae bacterium]